MMNAVQSALQDRVEEAILCADEREIIRAIEEGADVELQPRSKQFKEKINPQDDRPLTIIARVTYSDFTSNQPLRMHMEQTLLDKKAREEMSAPIGGAHDLVRRTVLLRDMESRWESVQRLVFCRQGGALWDRLPKVFDAAGIEEMTSVEHLFKGKSGFIPSANRTFIDTLPEPIDKFPESIELSMKVGCAAIDNFLAVANMAICRDALEAATVQGLIEDPEKKFMLFGAIVTRLGQLSPETGKILNDVRCIIDRDNYPIIANAIIKPGEAAIDLPKFYDADKLLQIMLDAGCDPNDRSSINDRTVLMLAAKFLKLSAIAILLDAGVDPAAKDKRNFTVLSHLGKTGMGDKAQAISRLLKAHAARTIMRTAGRKASDNANKQKTHTSA